VDKADFRKSVAAKCPQLLELCMFQTRAQLNNDNPCPKREHRAWNWEDAEHKSLSEAIGWLLEIGAAGFIITKDGEEVASNVVTHYS